MNKDKLITLIIKKQSYKDTKKVQAAIYQNKESAVNHSIQAIYQILNDNYNPQAKLYAIRYLKDCFQKGNPSFINQTEKKILPQLVKFVEDSQQQQAVLKYAASYPKSSDLQKFKRIILSFFIMIRQCIQKWASWIKDPQNQICKARSKIANKYGNYDRQFQYFRVENQRIFKENCIKNNYPLKYVQQSKQSVIPNKINLQNPSHSIQKSASNIVSHQHVSIMKASSRVPSKIESIFNKIQSQIDKMTYKQFEQCQKQFNAATNEYLQQAEQFDESYIEHRFEQLQNLRTRLQMRIKKEKQQKNSIKSRQTTSKQIQQKLQKVAPQFDKSQQAPKKMQEPIKGQKEEKKIQIVVIQPKKQIKSNKQKLADQKSAQISSIHPMSKLSGGFVQQRVNFSVSSSQQQQESRNAEMIKYGKQQQKKSTAKFILDEFKYNPPPIPPKNKVTVTKKSEIDGSLPVEPSSSRVEFNHSPQTSYSHISNNKSKLNRSQKQEHNTSINRQLNRIAIQNEKKQNQKRILEGKVGQLERQIFLLQQNESKRINQLQNSTSQTKVNSLKKQLIEQKNSKNLLIQEVNQLKNQLNRLKNNYSKHVHQTENLMSHMTPVQARNSALDIPHSSIRKSQISNRSSYKINRILDNPNIQQQHFPTKLMSPPESQPFSPRIDQDYIQNKTHSSNIRSWLSLQNTLRFKLCVLGLSEIFYEDQNVSVSKVQHLFSQDTSDFLKMTFSYKFRRCQNSLPKIKHKNMPQIDLWTKPVNGRLEHFNQQIVGKLCMVPLKIMKTQIESENNINFTILLPFMYYNYLRPQQFEMEQFEQIFRSKKDFVIKSKVFYLNGAIADTPKKYAKIFINSCLHQNYLQFCLGEETYERIFMIQIQFLKNQKAIVRILPIPATGSMATKAKQVLSNITFLIGQ